MTRPGRIVRGLLLLACLVSVGVALGGCNVIGVAAYKLKGPPVQPALFTPETRTTLVLVEHAANRSVYQLDADRLSFMIVDLINERQLAPLVSPDLLIQLRSDELGRYYTMSPEERGRRLGAEQVLYVDVLAVGASEAIASNIYSAKASATVRLINVADGSTLWPDGNAAGQPVGYEMRMRTVHANASASALRGELLAELARRVVRNFHEWSPDEFTDSAFD
ncbi:MAG: hypothetical protein ACFCVE_10510 [Phycisphaerae bacterium]